MTPRLLPLLLAAATLAGCDLAPHYRRPAPATPAAFPQGPAYPALSASAGDPTTIGWRDFFTDPRLQKTIALGLANNRDLQAAAANVLAARAQYRVQRADLLPTIGATADASISHAGSRAAAGTGTGGAGAGGGGTVHRYSVDVGFSAFELDLFGRVRNLSKAALERYFSTRSAQDSVRISLIAELATAWLTLAADQDQLRLSQETLKSYEQSLGLTRAQFGHGIVSELDVQQAETNVQTARYDVAQLTTQIAQDQNALDLLAGTTVPADLLPTGLGAGDYTMANLPAGLSSAVLLKRPDVLSAEHELKADNADIGAARAAFFPQISLTAAAGTASTALGGLFSAGSFTWSGSGSGLLSIFDFGRNRANLHYAEAERKAAVANYQKAVQTAFREVSDALATRGTIGTQLDAAAARAAAARKAAMLSEARYRNGIDPFLTTLIAQRSLYGAQQQLTLTRLTHEANLVELYRALGGGLQEGAGTNPAE